jgi:uncharacterized protein YjbJ (UPF0337 family)
MKAQQIACACALAALTLTACERGGDDGASQKTKGHIESAAGSMIGSDKLKRDGKKDEVVGGVKGAVGDVKDAVHDAAH